MNAFVFALFFIVGLVVGSFLPFVKTGTQNAFGFVFPFVQSWSLDGLKLLWGQVKNLFGLLWSKLKQLLHIS